MAVEDVKKVLDKVFQDNKVAISKIEDNCYEMEFDGGTLIFKGKQGNKLLTIEVPFYVVRTAVIMKFDKGGDVFNRASALFAVFDIATYKSVNDIEFTDIATAVAPIASGPLSLYITGVCILGDQLLQAGKTLKAMHSAEITAYMLYCDYDYESNWKVLQECAEILGTTADKLYNSIIGEDYEMSFEEAEESLKGLYDNGEISKDKYKKLLNQLEESREKAEAAETKVDPVVIDLSGNGQTTVSIDNGVNFDLGSNGFAEKTQWIESKDGFLVRDLNSNGKIDNGRELIGDNQVLSNGELSKNGLEVLLDMDKNKDGYLDSDEIEANNLLIWRDSNSNGITDSGELTSLLDLGIEKIKLFDKFIDNVKIGSVIMKDGSEKQLHDVFFNTDNLDSIELNGDIELSDEVRDLPQVIGSGVVVNLRKAMEIDRTLRNMIKDYINNISITSLEEINSILFRWCGVDDIEISSRGGNIDARVLGVIEKFIGTKFVGVNGENPNSEAATILENMYDNIKSYVMLDIGIQTYLPQYIDMISILKDKENNKIGYNFSQLEEFILNNNDKGKMVLIVKQLTDLYSDNILMKFELNDLVNTLKIKSAEFEAYYKVNNFIYGTNNNEILSENNKDDLVLGYGGNDVINGGYGDDIIDGGTGNDTLSGGAGNDTHIFRKGYGQDIIDNYYRYTDDNDKLIMKDINASDVTLSKDGNNLVISVNGSSDKVTIQNHYSSQYYRLDNIEFANGTVVSCNTSTGDFDLTSAVSMLKQTYCSTSNEEAIVNTSSYNTVEAENIVNLFAE